MMNRGRLIIGGLGLASGLVLGLAGCGGHSGCFDCNQQSYAGTWEGSGINSAGMFSVDLTITQGGAISGSETQLTGGTGTWTVSGSTDVNGNASITLTPATGTPITETGVLNFAGQGVIQVAFYQSGSNTPIPVSIANGNGLFSGNYTGSYSLSTGTAGTEAITIDVNGNVTGTLTPTSGAASTVTGTVNPLGVASLTVTPTGGAATTFTGGASYNTSEALLVTAVNGTTALSMNLVFQSNARRPAFILRK